MLLVLSWFLFLPPGGTGTLFFEFHRVMRVIQDFNKGRHLFWLFENVSPMPTDIKKTISRFLGVSWLKYMQTYKFLYLLQARANEIVCQQFSLEMLKISIAKRCLKIAQLKLQPNLLKAGNVT